MANQPDIIPMAWAANNSTADSIPETTSESGKASWDQGFPVETSLPLSQGGVPPKYGDFNGILNILSQFALYAQQGGQYAWSNALAYGVGSIVLGTDGNLYRAAQESTAVNPVGDASGKWEKIITLADLQAYEVIATGSTEPRTLQSRFADVRNIADFGAVGDGVADDSAALSAALAVGGKILFESSKTYYITENLFLPNGDVDIDLNGSTIKGGNLILAPSDCVALEYDGLKNIFFHNGTLEGTGIVLFHNQHVYIDNTAFLNSAGQHHIQICATNDIHITNCYFKGLKGTTASNPHYESINIDPCWYTALKLYTADAATYDGTKNKDVFIDNCVWEIGTDTGYGYLDSCVGTHDDDGAGNLHEGIYINNCSMRGVKKWAVRANSWKDSVIRNCYIETEHFAFDTGYQQRSQNITFENNMIVQNYALYSEAPLHFGPYRGSDITLTGNTYKDTSGTAEANPLKNLMLFANAASGATNETYSPWRCTDIYPVRDGLFSLGSADIQWRYLYAKTLVASTQLVLPNTSSATIVTPSDTGRVIICSGISGQSQHGAKLTLATAGYSSSGYFSLQAGNEGGYSGLAGYPDGTLTWGGQPVQTSSDERLKMAIGEVPDNVLDAWGEVQWTQFKFRDAAERKGEENCRWHAGLVAQHVRSACEEKGVDALRYGILCHEEWQDEYETVEITDAEAVYDEEGREITPAKKHTEQHLVREAGEQWMVRYEEALAMEAAYQRRRADRAEARIAALESRLIEMEATLASLIAPVGDETFAGSEEGEEHA